MGLDIANYEHKTQDAIKAFGDNREKARQKQLQAGEIDQGERSGVTAGKNLDGFVALIAGLVLRAFVSSFAGRIAAEAS